MLYCVPLSNHWCTKGLFSVVELRPCKSWWKVWVAVKNGSASMCPVRASLRFMSLKTVLSSWAQPLSSVQEMNFAIQRMSSHLVLLSTCTRPASQGRRWKAWLLGSKDYNIIVTTISHTHARTHTHIKATTGEHSTTAKSRAAWTSWGNNTHFLAN